MLEHFLPKYPNVDNTKYDILNRYSETFNEAIYKKKEFYENKLDERENLPMQRGVYMRHQNTIARYLSSHTPYDSLILVHEPGTGKTCSVISAIELIKNEHSLFTGALILARGEKLLNNFINELVFKCTPGNYVPENYENLTSLEKTHRINKKIRSYYKFNTFAKFAKRLKKFSDADIKSRYSNLIIVIDEVHNLRIQVEKDKESIEIYEQFHRFLHNISNTKVVLLSATPMKDSPEEVASILNLILPYKQQLPNGEDFLREYMFTKNDIYYPKPEKIEYLKSLFKGKVSYLRAMQSNVTKEFVGKSGIYGLKYIIIDPLFMKSFQSKYYTESYRKDTDEKEGIYNNSREATLFVYPDGSYGSKGFKNYIKEKDRKVFELITKKDKIKRVPKKRFIMDNSLISELKGSSTEETLDKISKYSIVYYTTIRNILLSQNKAGFIYSSIVKGSGLILFSLILELFGFTKANGNETTTSPRYVLLTGDSNTDAETRKIINRFNKPDNIKGEYIRIILGSRAISEGFSFRHIQYEVVLTPHFNYSETIQAISRGLRLDSHNDLLKNGITPTVKIYQPVSFSKNNKTPSIDLYMYKLSEDKDVSIQSIIRLIMEASFDCGLNYIRNRVKGQDGSRECEYTTCNYECDELNMALIKKALNNDELDYSTYNLYYANPRISSVYKRIENILRENINIEFQVLLKLLEKEFNGNEITIALESLVTDSSQEINYLSFLNNYNTSPVQMIINGLEKLFLEKFYISIEKIYNYFNQYTQFEIMSALNILINENMTIKNKYGFTNYLREKNNIYFLVSHISETEDLFSVFYTKYPSITEQKYLVDILKDISEQRLPENITSLCSVKNEKEFTLLIKTFSLEIQEQLIEVSIEAEEKDISVNVDFRNFVLSYFKSYIKRIKNLTVSTFLENKGILRCRKNGSEWIDCTEKYIKKLRKYEESATERIREQNPYGIIAKYNPETKAFCIVDLEKEKERHKEGDKRTMYLGKVCSSGGWKLPELVNIVINRLKINPPSTWKVNYTDEKMISYILSDSKLSELYNNQDLQKMSTMELKRLVYWGLPSKLGGVRGIKPICEGIKDWFEEKGLLEIDNLCGVQGKRQKKESVAKAPLFRIEIIIPQDKKEEIKEHFKQISSVMNNCFNIKRYKVDVNSKIPHVLIYYRKKLCAFALIIDSKLEKLCITKTYKKFAEQLLRLFVANSYTNIIKLNNTDIDYKIQLDNYIGLGKIKIFKDDGKVTLLKIEV